MLGGCSCGVCAFLLPCMPPLLPLKHELLLVLPPI
jgi:hypothetical protein